MTSRCACCGRPESDSRPLSPCNGVCGGLLASYCSSDCRDAHRDAHARDCGGTSADARTDVTSPVGDSAGPNHASSGMTTTAESSLKSCACCWSDESDYCTLHPCDGGCGRAWYCSPECRETHRAEHAREHGCSSGGGGVTRSGSKPKRSKKPVRPMEELLTPIAKTTGVPDISLSELEAKCEGDGSLWLGCKGRVFDMSGSDGASFYGKGGAYSSFIGKDVSVALGKMRFNPEFMDPTQLHWSRDLDEEELNILEDWLEKFEGKYEVVAYIKDDGAKVA